MNKNSMTYWWPLGSKADVPVPETVAVPVLFPRNLWSVLDGSKVPDGLLAEIGTACTAVGYPAFLRGDLCAGKHDYQQTCYVDSPKVLAQHVYHLIEASVLGPGDVPQAFYARKLLDLDSPFRAFLGLPMARERRYFVADGDVVCHHPYWPEDALRFPLRQKRPRLWQVRLAAINKEDINEIARLTTYTLRLGAVLPGAWSVDFACDRSGKWWWIDAALAEESWHPEHLKGT